MPKRTRKAAVPTRAAKPEVNAVLRKLRNLGLQLEFSAGTNHWRVIDPGTGAFLTTVSGTPSDVNWWHHVRRAVERAGFSWEGRVRKRIKKPRAGEVSAVDLEALAHAQRMARIHGGREPQIDDLSDKGFLTRVRKGFNEQETEEAIEHMPQGVESARAHRVVSRLLYIVEQRGEEMAARARQRNPRIRDGGGVTNELVHLSGEVAKKRGLRYWKTPESAWNTCSNLLSGTNAGMSVWVANLLEATMDEIDGLRWDSNLLKPSVPPVVSTGESDPLRLHDSKEEARGLILDVLSSEWTPRADAYSTLVPEQMSNSRFEEALGSLVIAGRVKRMREAKKAGGMLYQLVVTSEPTVEPEPQSDRLSKAEAEKLVLACVTEDWAYRNHIMGLNAIKGVSPRTAGRRLTDLVNRGLIERERLASGQTQYRLSQPAPVPQSSDEPPTVVSPEMLPEGETKRSLLQAISGGSIADRYADALLDILRSQTANGTQDWRQMEPILARLDKLAGVGQEE